MVQKDATSLEDLPAFINVVMTATLQIVDSEQVKKMSWIWIAIPGKSKDQTI